MAKQTVNIGTSENKGDGDPLRTAFQKINENFDELYTGSFNAETDIKGSIFGDDSTLLVDGVNNSIPSSVIQGSEADNWTEAYGWGDHATAGYLTTETDPVVGAVNGIVKADGAGNISAAVAGTDYLQYAEKVQFTAKNASGSTLEMGTVVYISGLSGNTPEVDRAKADSSSTMPAFGIVQADTLNNNEAIIITFGSCPGHDASIFAETGITFAIGDTLYVSAAEAGKMTNVPPAGESNKIQNIGKVERAMPTTNMTLKVGGAGRTNATPALDEGNIFIGDANNRAVTASLATSISTNLKTINGESLVGVGDITISGGGTETDPIVGAVNGIVKADGAGNIAAAVAGTDYSTVSSINDLSDVDTATAAPYRDAQPLVWDTVDGNWYPGNSISIDGIARIETGGNLYFDANSSMVFQGTTVNGIVTEITASDPSQGNAIVFPNASGTLALTSDIPTAYTDSDVDTHLNTSTASPNEVLSWTGSVYDWVPQSGGGSADLTWTITKNSYSSSFEFSGPGIETGNEFNPELQLIRGYTYKFSDTDNPTTLEIRTSENGSAYTPGVTTSGNLTTFTVPYDAPDTLYYETTASSLIHGVIKIVNANNGLQSRSTATGTTTSLADAAEADLDITGFKSYLLLTITTDRAARVRLYVSAATRTADANRAEGVDPTSDAGLIAEVITTGAETVIISPGAYGFNLESSPTTTIPCRVTNKSGGTSTVQVDLNILQLEA